MKTKYQITILALVFMLIIASSYVWMNGLGQSEARAPLPTAPIGGDVPPPPVDKSEMTYNVNDVSVRILVDVLPVYEAPYVGSEKITEQYKNYVWIVREIRSTADGNFWGKLGEGWVLLYDAKILNHEATDWSLEKWDAIGRK